MIMLLESVWMKTGLSSLTWPESDLTLVPGEAAHHSSTLSYQCAQLEPAINPHISLHGNMERRCHVSFHATFIINLFVANPTTGNPRQKEPTKSHLGGV